MHSPRASAAEVAVSTTSHPLHIVLADDERDTVLTLTELLRAEGHTVKGFTNGRDALTAVLCSDPDVVILDVAMPGLSGWDVARQIRLLSGGARPLLIAMTGQCVTRGHQIFAGMIGFNHYLTKPCTPDALLAVLARPGC